MVNEKKKIYTNQKVSDFAKLHYNRFRAKPILSSNPLVKIMASPYIPGNSPQNVIETVIYCFSDRKSYW